MRHFIRHPVDIPIEFNMTGANSWRKQELQNISEGGLCFRADAPLRKGTSVRIAIPIQDPPFEVDAEVAWCKHSDAGNEYDVGVKFYSEDTEFAVRMVEQACYIEKYKRDIYNKEGRSLTGEQATLEWINKFAAEFPQ